MNRSLLSPKIDFVFKKIFGSEDHPAILISFLNAVLKPTKKDEISALANAEEKGIEKGIEQGIIESAKKLLNILDDKTISETLGIDINRVKDLRKF